MLEGKNLPHKGLLTVKAENAILCKSMRGGAAWKLVGLITRRSRVQIPPPLPLLEKTLRFRGVFFIIPIVVYSLLRR